MTKSIVNGQRSMANQIVKSEQEPVVGTIDKSRRPSRLTIDHLRLTSIDDRGIALLLVLLVMTLILSTTGASLYFGGLNSKVSSNIKTGRGALYAAEAGIQHGLVVIPGGDTFSYSTETTILNAVSFGNGYTYTVKAINDAASTGGNSRAILTSEATGPNGSKKKVKAYIVRSSSWTPPGGAYLQVTPGASPYYEFGSQDFRISGNDTTPGQDCAASGGQLPGVSTTAGSATSDIIGHLATTERDQVTGTSSTPSVTTASSVLDVETLITNLLTLGVEGVDKQTLAAGTYTTGTWGTEAAPKITYLQGSAHNYLKGTLTGYGILIHDGQLYTGGSFTWHGLTIGRSHAHFHPSYVSGAGKVWGGALWKDPYWTELSVGGSTKICYSSQTVNTVVAKWRSAFPRVAKLIGWHEVM
jgi:hypothetical protein